MKKIKTRATLYVFGLVLILITLFIATIIQNKNKLLDEKIQAHQSLIKNSFDLSLLDTQKGLSELAYSLAADREVVDAFENHDRKALYAHALPYFSKEKKAGNVDFTGFIGADGIHFLRLQQPEKYGDNLTKKRPMLAYALQTRHPITALDITLFDVAIVTIVPVFKGEHFIGIIQTAAKIERLQKHLDEHSGIKSALAFDTQKLSNVLENNNKSIHYQEYSIVSSNDPLFEHLPTSFSFQTSERYSIYNETYVITSRPLNDYSGQKIAMMICAFDTTTDMAHYNKDLRDILIISFILLVSLGIVLHYGFQVFLRRIEKDSELTHALNRKLEHQLLTDTLTSLPNRDALLRDLSLRPCYALMLLNIDNFKEINDFYGNSIGDEALLALSNSIRNVIASSPMSLYKMPSDEYALTLDEPLTESKLETLRHTLFEYLHVNYYDFSGAHIYISLTMGMDICPNACIEHGHQLLTNADMALMMAKKRHLSFLVYDETMQIKQEYQNNLLWSKKVKEAIEENRFILYYQPIIDPHTHSVVEYEALIRLIDTDGAIIAPNIFLPAAKQSRLYPLITRFVVESIFTKLETTAHRISINLSVDDILDTPTREFIFEHVRHSSHAYRVIFELLESEGIENYTEVSSFIAEVKQYGCAIAIDDFGTGYSNFSHILRLNVDLLKIDGSLIRNIDFDTNAQTIITAVTKFSKRLGIKTVAEFVHSQAVHDKCIELGIDYLQGYHLGKPATHLD
jgi:diguanylate cyclase (GGDEF)-like protein